MPCNAPNTVELTQSLYSEQHQQIPSSHYQLSYYIRDSSGLTYLQRSTTQTPEKSRFVNDLMNAPPSLRHMLDEVLGLLPHQMPSQEM